MPETVVRFDDRRPIPAAVFVGNENDNLVERVVFELADWLADATVYIYLTVNGKSDVVNLGTGRVFDITRTHTHEAGRWEAYLEAYLNGDRVWHSDEFAMYVGKLPAIGEQIEQQYPTAIEEALAVAEMLMGMGARIEMLPEGSEPTVRTEEIDGRVVLVFGIPAGGGSGAGQNGATFIPHVSEDGTVYWTNNGGLPNPTPVNIMGPQGLRGEQGPAGPAGYSPVRGTDYWTAADIAEIKAYVDTAILGGEW